MRANLESVDFCDSVYLFIYSCIFFKILREDKGVETKLCLEERAYFAESKTIMVNFVLDGLDKNRPGQVEGG